MAKVELLDIHCMEEDLIFLKHRYLNQHGWKTSSSHPGGMWLWIRKHNGIEYGCGLETAVQLQKYIDFHEGEGTNEG